MDQSDVLTRPKPGTDFTERLDTKRPSFRMSDDPDALPFAPTFMLTPEGYAEGAAAERRIRAEITRLGLDGNRQELEENGFTVLRPDQVASRDVIDELRDLVLKISGRRSGRDLDAVKGASREGIPSPFGDVQFELTLIPEHVAFERVIMNERALALITFLLGETCKLDSLSSMVKGQGPEYLPLHVDTDVSHPYCPLVPYAQTAGATWTLTDYTIENGPICFVSGSHRYCRKPDPKEATDISRFEPIEMPAGSIVVWHGNTWHGALPRRAPGLRLNLQAYYQRAYLETLDHLASYITPEMIERNGPRFALLTGVAKHYDDMDGVKAKALRVSPYA